MQRGGSEPRRRSASARAKSSLPKNVQYQFKFLHAAITELVLGPDHLRNRLAYAAEHFLCILPGAAPGHLRSDIAWVRDYLTEFKAVPGMPYPFDSDVRVTMRRRRTSTAVRCAKKMWALHFLFRSALDS
jgi:hypothetical protein